MAAVVEYNRGKAVAYADKWALSRNPRYLDFSNLGGDCTNFASQCLYAGSGVMNYTPVYGWYYINSYNRTPSWTGVQFLYNFLTTNTKQGVFAVQSDISSLDLGDIIQLGDANGRFYHSLVVTRIDGYPSLNNIYICTHTIDSKHRPLNSYTYSSIRFLHIKGVYV